MASFIASTTTTTTAVEAASLSELTAIAASPPLDPNTRLQATFIDPLVLYFARVPGSRDVFLTPIKPRDKVVSAEDVQSSLYYVHINCIDDHHFLQQVSRVESGLGAGGGRDEERSARTTAESGAGISKPPALPTRKPVLGSQGLLSPRRAVDKAASQTITRHAVPRKPALADISNSQHPTPSTSYPDLPTLPRRPLPFYPAENGPAYDKSLHASNLHLLQSCDHSAVNNPYYRDYEPQVATDKAPDAAIAAHELGSLTLIRRDPTSSQQWNVATIHDPPVHEISSSSASSLLLRPGTGAGGAARRVKKGGAPLYLDITNPGYGQFNDPDRRTASRSGLSTSTGDSDSADSQPQPTAPEGIFRRRLYMPGSRFADHTYASQLHHHRNASFTDGSDSMRRTMHQRSLSDFSVAPTTTDKRSRSYAFTSPWDGDCEFSTGPAGRTLKCRHTLRRRSDHDNRRGSTIAPTTVFEDVSELRFNLPTSSAARSTPTADSVSAGNTKRTPYFMPTSRHPRRAGHDSWDGSSTEDTTGGGSSRSPFALDEDGRLDLSLGRERAGGGFSGKQAKLGKLIIEPEGLKMLDLLVAANVGLWWRAWERT